MCASKIDDSVVLLARALRSDLAEFISNKKIDEEKVQRYDAVLKILETRRNYWALNRELPPIDSIKIYGAYSTVYGTLCGVAHALNEGIQRKENPKAAKDVYSIVSSAIELLPKLEIVHRDKQAPSQFIADIFDSSRALRKQAISQQLIQAGEKPDRIELIKELRTELEEQLS
ncbi:MAG: hypothetical protein NTV88_01935 [Candidatus Micrarchaeota archaeon]|nr:hypothetical protein [Candidatus Micrarchaeota archaeon]